MRGGTRVHFVLDFSNLENQQHDFRFSRFMLTAGGETGVSGREGRRPGLAVRAAGIRRPSSPHSEKPSWSCLPVYPSGTITRRHRRGFRAPARCRPEVGAPSQCAIRPVGFRPAARLRRAVPVWRPAFRAGASSWRSGGGNSSRAPVRREKGASGAVRSTARAGLETGVPSRGVFGAVGRLGLQAGARRLLVAAGQVGGGFEVAPAVLADVLGEGHRLVNHGP